MYRSMFSSPQHWLELSDSRPNSFVSGAKVPLPIGKEAELVPGPVRKAWEGRQYCRSAHNQSLYCVTPVHVARTRRVKLIIVYVWRFGIVLTTQPRKIIYSEIRRGRSRSTQVCRASDDDDDDDDISHNDLQGLNI
jgi:hypothetical protein